MSAPAPSGIAADREAFCTEGALRDAAPDLLAALERMMPTNICLTNANVPDSTVVALNANTTVGELRELAALIARAKGGAA